jgi:hypothetical protein
VSTVKMLTHIDQSRESDGMIRARMPRLP